MRKDVNLRDGRALLNRPGRKFTISQYFDEGNPGGVCKSLENIGSALFNCIRYGECMQVR